ncbi:MAG: protease inhibitor I42 family protein [Methanoregula sp.]|nr:protease inhibitor I42 family protein [Methanoregula sp.]
MQKKKKFTVLPFRYQHFPVYYRCRLLYMGIYNRTDKKRMPKCGSDPAPCRGKFCILPGGRAVERKWIYLGIAGILVVIVIIGIGMSMVNSFDESSNNATVSVTQGDTITISLGENPKTGFRWVANVTPGLAISRDTYESGNPIGEMMGMLGAGGTRTWHITAVQTGTQTFSAVKVRSDTPYPVNIYSITFQVSNR